jgi:outer membrane lipopolysaccharide assembly protein LptE/RlpB
MGYRKIFFLLPLFFLLYGCGYYSFRGALPPELKNLYIENFKTNTAFYNAEQNLTSLVEKAFLTDNTLKLVSKKEDSDLIIKGRITSIRLESFSIAEGASQSDDDKLTVTVSVDCFRKDLNKSLWKKNWSRYLLVPATASQEELEKTLLGVLAQISDDIVLNTVAAW